jgi:hypothetical protein
MKTIERYVLWPAHDAGGTLPPVDVVAAIVPWRLLPGVQEAQPAGEVCIFVPPQWLGDWDSGCKLAPAYQHLWRVPSDILRALPDPPPHTSYRPDELPPSACGPSPLQRRYRPTSRSLRGKRSPSSRGSDG